jgi:hypothetical protein
MFCNINSKCEINSSNMRNKNHSSELRSSSVIFTTLTFIPSITIDSISFSSLDDKICFLFFYFKECANGFTNASFSSSESFPNFTFYPSTFISYSYCSSCWAWALPNFFFAYFTFFVDLDFDFNFFRGFFGF